MDAFDRRQREEAIKRAPVKCPACGGSDIVAGDPAGFACDGCGKKARLRDFRACAVENKTPEQRAAEEAETKAALDRIADLWGKSKERAR